MSMKEDIRGLLIQWMLGEIDVHRSLMFNIVNDVVTFGDKPVCIRYEGNYCIINNNSFTAFIGSITSDLGLGENTLVVGEPTLKSIIKIKNIQKGGIDEK